jgi:Undecaprenyl-phosphate galactose phosphotransferase WbaP
LQKTSNAVSSYSRTEQAGAPASRADHVLGPREPAWRQWGVTVTLVSSDVLLALLIWYVAYLFQDAWGQSDLSEIATAVAAANVGVWVGLRALLGLYPGYGMDQVEELRRQTYAVGAALAVTSIFAFAFQVGGLISRLLMVWGFLGLLLLAPLVRYLVKRQLAQAGLWGKPVVILGAGETGQRMIKTLEREWSFGFRPLAVFDNRLAPVEKALEGVPYRGTVSDAMALAHRRITDTAILAMPDVRPRYLNRFVNRASTNFRNVIIIPDLAGVAASAVAARDFAGIMGVEVRYNLLDPWARRIKRALDISAVLVGGALISPLLLAIALLIKLESSGPALFVQRRPGLRGNTFGIFKFRTMYADAERRLEQLLRENTDLAREFQKHGKLKYDPRVTRIGRFLRKTSLDELPQLWNVLKGEMSLVGPRPYLYTQVSQMNGTSATISRVAPGISGLWQVSGRSTLPFEQRLDLDVYYVRNWSVWLDIVILARTMKSVLSRVGAY